MMGVVFSFTVSAGLGFRYIWKLSLACGFRSAPRRQEDVGLVGLVGLAGLAGHAGERVFAAPSAQTSR